MTLILSLLLSFLLCSCFVNGWSWWSVDVILILGFKFLLSSAARLRSLERSRFLIIWRIFLKSIIGRSIEHIILLGLCPIQLNGLRLLLRVEISTVRVFILSRRRTLYTTHSSAYNYIITIINSIRGRRTIFFRGVTWLLLTASSLWTLGLAPLSSHRWTLSSGLRLRWLLHLFGCEAEILLIGVFFSSCFGRGIASIGILR